MSSGELVRQDTAIQEAEPSPANILQVIANAARNPEIDANKMEKLLAMHERILDRQARTAFSAALARLQAKLPQIEKTAKITVKGQERSRYAPLEDIDAIIRPLLAEEGFAFSFDEESTTDKTTKFVCTLSHREGHSEVKHRTFPIDYSDFRTNIQSYVSTTSYARRSLITMHLNLVTRDEDMDGNDRLDPIDKEKVHDLETMIQDSKSDRAKFLHFMGVERLEDIPKKDYMRAVNALQTKQRRAQ